jgi:hypothetical protein
MFAACSTNPPARIGTQTAVSVSDTVGLAEFKEWKAEQKAEERSHVIREVEKVKTVYVSTPAPASPPVASPSKYPDVPGASNGGYEDEPISSETEAEIETVQKNKGWSKAAKGAAIGAGSGAVIGAVINKRNRAVGAVIGGVAGGAVGYGIGRGMDKRDGRY